MNHLVEELGRLGSGADQTTPDDVVRRDLLRGRAALARRRARRTVTGLGVTAATAVLALALTGAQLPGFTVAKAPEGSVLQGANAYSLDIAPRANTTSLDDYRGKLVVLLQSKDAAEVPAGKQVEVNGHPGTISTVDPTAKQLYYSEGTHQIVVQSPPEIGLTDAALLEFASGVTVTAQAAAGVG